MKIWHAPLGKLIQGHVLDVNVKKFTEALQHYDEKLYVKWNPKKLRGHGCWEIRRKPNRKTQVFRGVWNGMIFYELRDVEFNDIHHVLDCAFLNYDAIRKLKEMDTWNVKNFSVDLEKREEEARAKIQAKALDEFKYTLKQHKSLAHDIYEAVRSGVDLGRLVTAYKG